MAIDKSFLTHTIYLVSAIICCVITQKKHQNSLRTFLIFLWTSAIYFVIACSILPIQFTNSGIHMAEFSDQFSMMTAEQFKKYFLSYFLYNMSYFTSYLSLSFVGVLLFSKLRTIKGCIIFLLSLLLIHVGYNIALNILVDEVVKAINAEDILIIILGFLTGWLCGKVTLKVAPTFSEKILSPKCGG